MAIETDARTMLSPTLDGEPGGAAVLVEPDGTIAVLVLCQRRPDNVELYVAAQLHHWMRDWLGRGLLVLA